MIYNERQYRVSLSQLEKLQATLTTLEQPKPNKSWLKRAELDALRSQISQIEAELADYQLLKSGQVSFSKTFSLEELPRVLVQARIARGISQTELADKLGMKPQQIQRYEATGYAGANLTRLVEVSRELGVKTSGTFESTNHLDQSVFVWTDTDDVAWRQLPYKEMIKRKWFTITHGTNPLEAVKQYMLSAAGPQFTTAYHRKKMRSNNVPNEYALLAWQARVLQRSQELVGSGDYAEFDLNDTWIPSLVKLTTRKDGPRLVGGLLATKGIVLVIEKHLPGSYLDGAAMLGHSDHPIIGLTLRYDRLDNFWFVLLHELGHIFLHLFTGLRYDFFDEESATDTDSVEAQADQFALDALIPNERWDQCLSRYALSEESVLIDAENLQVDPSIVAGRIRKERNDYTILSHLVGQGQLRTQFKEIDDALD